MARKYTPSAGETAHVTIRCNNKEFLFDLQKNFNGMVSWINCLPAFFNVTLHHVMFMSNHMHLLLTPQEDNLGIALSYSLTNLSKYLNYTLERTNHIFGNRNYPSVIKDKRHLMNVIRYLYQNPVRAGIVPTVRDYPYSSLNFYLKGESLGFWLQPDIWTHRMFDSGVAGLIAWFAEVDLELNDDDLGMMKKSMRRRVFKFTRRQQKTIRDGSFSIVS